MEEPAKDGAEARAPLRHCAQPPRRTIVLAPEVGPMRASAVRLSRNKWVNGTILHYVFLESEMWDWPDDQKDEVRRGFDVWRSLGIGLGFVETDDETEAEIKIGRLQNNRSWSFVGTEILRPENRIDGCTMNFGWDLRTAWGRATAIHEIGHTLGLEHEHQNQRSGIVWDEEAVYAAFAQSNGWEREDTYHNILEKLPANGAEGSAWDPTSIMHYPFEPGLIKLPQPYDRDGIGENVTLSAPDRSWALRWYPANPQAAPIVVMQLARFAPVAATQRDFVFEPNATREYQVQTLGTADCKIVIFEERDGEPRHLDAEDDSGTPDNAMIRTKFVAGRRYIIRVRVHFASGNDDIGLIIL